MKNKSKFASLCVLAYKRTERLHECINSIIQTTTYPYELIVNLDGGDFESRDYLYSLFLKQKISKLILNNGMNRGVGRSFANCIGVAEGDYICKIDSDLTFMPGWLEKGIAILDKGIVDAVSFFNYRNYDPADTRFNIMSAHDGYCVVDDFVSSIYLFERKHLLKKGWDQDDGFHQQLRPLAITDEDYVKNHGFGVGKSVYVVGTEDHPRKAETFNTPLLFSAQLPNEN